MNLSRPPIGYGRVFDDADRAVALVIGLPVNSPLSALVIELLPGGVGTDTCTIYGCEPAAAVILADPPGPDLRMSGCPQRLLRVSPLVAVAPAC